MIAVFFVQVVLCLLFDLSRATYFLIDQEYLDMNVDEYCLRLKGFDKNDELSFFISEVIHINISSLEKIMHEIKQLTVPYLAIEHSNFEALDELLPLLPALKSLTLKTTSLVVSNQIIGALKSQATLLESLYLNEVEFDASSCNDLALFLSASTSIKNIYISNPIGIASWNVMAEALGKNLSLTSISIREVEITDEISTPLTSGFSSRSKDNKISVCIAEDKLSSDAGLLFKDFITKNEGVKFLPEENPKGDDEAFLIFRKHYKKSPPTWRFQSGSWAITNRGALMMAKMLRRQVDGMSPRMNGKIYLDVYLRFNKIGYEGMKAFIELISSNPDFFKRCVVFFHGNAISMKERRSLALDPICADVRDSSIQNQVILPRKEDCFELEDHENSEEIFMINQSPPVDPLDDEPDVILPVDAVQSISEIKLTPENDLEYSTNIADPITDDGTALAITNDDKSESILDNSSQNDQLDTPKSSSTKTVLIESFLSLLSIAAGYIVQ